MRILFVFATSTEAEVLSDFTGPDRFQNDFRYGEHEINILITGVGGILTAWSLKQWLCSNRKPDLAINAGIAGSFNSDYPKGSVVMPVSDCFADMGMETENSFITLSESGLTDKDEFPFKDGRIWCINDYIEKLQKHLSPVTAITVNTTSGTAGKISMLKNKFNPDIETMEGATFFYICARENIPFLALRSVSNMVVPDRKDKWEINLALDNLAGKMNVVLKFLL